MSEGDHIVLVGPPNSGKTTLFNWMTGLSRKTVNYPGSTVEVSTGSISKKKVGFDWCVTDTPGMYGFLASSPENQLTRRVLSDLTAQGKLRGVVLVLDSTRLSRQLPFVLHLRELGIPFVVALTMSDIKTGGSPRVNVKRLSHLIKAEVVSIEGLLGGGVLDLLKKARAVFDKKPPAGSLHFPKEGDFLKKQEAFLKQSEKWVQQTQPPRESLKVGVKTRWVDSYLLHPVFGFCFLCSVLFAFFSSLFWLAAPLMDGVDGAFSLMVESVLKYGGEKNAWVDFLANGVLTGFGAFFVFVPQVYILFVGIDLLEDSGYLARAAALVDGPFSRVGLSGRALIPFLSGFACAIPATLSARTISSRRERWLVTFVLPLTTCSARLPVYVLLLSFLFYGSSSFQPGLVMALLYLLSLVLAVATSGVLNLFFKSDPRSSFAMELPLYRVPVLSHVLFSAWCRTRHFILKAGPVIFLFALLMWGATHFPRSPGDSPYTQVEQSYAGRLGKLAEPVFEKMGGDWRVGVGLFSAFVAREVFVPVLAVTLKNTQSSGDAGGSLIQSMRSATTGPRGKPLFSTASVMALLVFFMISLQCLSTTGVVYRETGSLLLASVQLVVFNVLAYGGAVATFQVLS